MKNAKLPAPIDEPSQAPWVLVGGSYSGALTAWTMVACVPYVHAGLNRAEVSCRKPDLFAAGWASSAVVETIVYV